MFGATDGGGAAATLGTGLHCDVFTVGLGGGGFIDCAAAVDGPFAFATGRPVEACFGTGTQVALELGTIGMPPALAAATGEVPEGPPAVRGFGD